MRRKRNKYEPFLINPHRRKRTKIKWFKRTKRKRRKKRNEMAMTVGNPKRKGGVRKMGKRRRGRKKNSPANPRRRRKSIFRATRRRKRINPVYRRRTRRRNPIIGGRVMDKTTTMLIGALSAIATTAAPSLLKAKTTLTKYGSQVAVALLGSYLVGKMLRSSEKALIWSVVGGSVIVADLLKTYILRGILPGLESPAAVAGLGQYYYLPAPAGGMPGYYVPESEYSLVPTGPFG